MTTINKLLVKRALQLLASEGQRGVIPVLILVIISAITTYLMVGSVFPFLAVIADPPLIMEHETLSFLFDAGKFSSDFDFVVVLGVASFAVIVFSNVISLLQVWITNRFTQLVAHRLSVRLLSHYMCQPYEFFIQRHSGDMATNILFEAERAVRDCICPLMMPMRRRAKSISTFMSRLIRMNSGSETIANGAAYYKRTTKAIVRS